MSAAGAILTIIGSAIIFCLATYGGFTILANIEHRVTVRKRLRPLLASDEASGDIANVPSGFKVSHARKDAA